MEQAKHHEPKFSESFYDLAKYISDLRVRLLNKLSCRIILRFKLRVN